MPGDPNNPFNDTLNQLNGVVFDATDFYKISGAAPNADQTALIVGGFSQYGANGFTLNITDYTYISGYTKDFGAGPEYISPSFGTIQLAGVSGFYDTFLVKGFSTGGLLLYAPAVGDNSVAGGFAFWASGLGFMLGPDGFDTTGGSITFDLDPATFQAAICFAEGTQVDTPQGPRAVEAIVAGDLVMTASGVARPVKWTGWMLARPARHANPVHSNPVRVAAHAFGPDVPKRDVRLSPGHAVYIDGVLVPVGRLINGATIVQEAVEEVRYFHIELDNHDVLLAEGLPCESYLDDGNRRSFANTGDVTALDGRLDPKSWEDACAPLVAAGPQLDAIRQRLLVQAGALGWQRSEEAALSIVADGVEIAPLHSTGDRSWFAVPTADSVVLRSNSGVLGQIAPEMPDPRRLGVAVSALRVDGHAVPFDSPVFGAGFHATEEHGALSWRWTDGAATLALTGPAVLEIDVAMVAPSWTRAVPKLKIVA